MSQKKDDEAHRRWIACPTEEEYFGSGRRESRAERKRRSAKDRSKYKKTDREQRQKQEIEKKLGSDERRGRVLSISGEGILVESDHEQYLCVLRGALKKERRQYKNLVAVGDFVHFIPQPQGEGAITHVEPRQSVLSRAETLSHKKEQLIAANIDQVLITVSIVFPPMKPTLIDRYIIAARKGGMEPVILINKVDLLEDAAFDQEVRVQERRLMEEVQSAYSGMGIPVIALSSETGEGMERLKEQMQGKASVFSGQSGVGKSSLINQVTGLDLQIGEIRERTQKGTHTTTTAQLIPLEFGGWCIDTPGIKSFGVWELERDEVEEYFPDIQSIGQGCRYGDCSHVHEEECAVLDAVEEGTLSPIRYESYLSLIASIEEPHRRR